jgi:hypothetical protein
VEQQSAHVVSRFWEVKGIADFNGDGYSDILWRDRDGQVSFWYTAQRARRPRGIRREGPWR